MAENTLWSRTLRSTQGVSNKGYIIEILQDSNTGWYRGRVIYGKWSAESRETSGPKNHSCDGLSELSDLIDWGTGLVNFKLNQGKGYSIASEFEVEGLAPTHPPAPPETTDALLLVVVMERGLFGQGRRVCAAARYGNTGFYKSVDIDDADAAGGAEALSQIGEWTRTPMTDCSALMKDLISQAVDVGCIGYEPMESHVIQTRDDALGYGLP